MCPALSTIRLKAMRKYLETGKLQTLEEPMLFLKANRGTLGQQHLRARSEKGDSESQKRLLPLRPSTTLGSAIFWSCGVKGNRRTFTQRTGQRPSTPFSSMRFTKGVLKGWKSQRCQSPCRTFQRRYHAGILSGRNERFGGQSKAD